MTEPIDVMIFHSTPDMSQNWGWFLAFGILLSLLGITAIVRSIKATVVSMIFFGWLFIFTGIIEFANAFMVGRWTGFFLHLLLAVLFLATGAAMLVRPLISAETLTLLMSVFFLVAGSFQVIASLFLHAHGWGWETLNGAITAIMGILVLAQWPLSGLWVIGLFVGIDLICYGWAWIALALDLHKM